MATQLNSTSLKYQYIQEKLRELIKRSAPGDQLPSERKLAAVFNCNALTVRKSLAILVEEGLVIRRVGSGTFVAPRDLLTVAIPACMPPSANRLAVVMSHECDAYGYSVMQSVALAAKKRDVELRSVWTQAYGDDLLSQLEILKADGCSGLIVPWFPPSAEKEIVRLVEQSPIPACIPLLIPGLERNCFEHPDVFGKSMLAAIKGLCVYFQQLGWGKIALLGPNSPGNPILQSKLTSYACYASTHGLENIIGLVDETADSVDQLAQSWKDYRGDLAVVSYDDTHALRFVTAMHKLGLSAPDDFAIVGYNNIEASRTCDPPLTTVCQNFDYIGEGLVTSALALGQGRVVQSEQILAQRLLTRESCGGNRVLGESWLTGLPGLVPENDLVKQRSEKRVSV